MLFPALEGTSQNILDFRKPEVIKLFESPVLNALKKKQIKYLDKGSCPSPDNKHADASVTKLNIDGEVCFSLDSLSRLAPNTLQSKVFGLLLHEVIHLAGADEKTAAKWQERFDEFYLERIGVMSKHRLATRIMLHLYNAILYLRSAALLAEKDANDFRILPIIGLLAQHMAATPSYLDPLFLEINLRPARPDLVNNYTNSIIALIEKALAPLDINRRNAVSPKGEDLKKLLDELSEAMVTVMNNYMAYLQNKGKSVCLLPKSEFRAFPYFGSIDGHHTGLESTLLGVTAPPRVCDPVD